MYRLLPLCLACPSKKVLRIARATAAVGSIAALAACGGGSGSDSTSGAAGTSPIQGSSGASAPAGGSASGGASAPASGSSPVSATIALTITSLELAQTHVLADGSRSWAPPTPASASESLHLVGARKTLALVRLGVTDAQSPSIEGFLAGVSLGAMPLAAPAALAPTESQGPAYGTDLYSATLPAAWISPGVQLRVKANNYLPSAVHMPVVGANTTLTARILPFYLFGATDTNSGIALAAIAAPPAAATSEMLAKWPVASLNISNHPAARLSWPTLVVRPRPDASGVAQPAYVVSNASQQKDGFAIMSSVLSVLNGMLKANGESSQPVAYYAPLVMLDANGAYFNPHAGLGLEGGDVSTGNPTYAGIYIHEMGHALGLPHAGEAYDIGQFPYLWGSLDGSAWGYDSNKQQLLAPFVPTTASSHGHCTTDTFSGHARALDAMGRCIKQDPMQSGDGDQASGYAFATFSDYNTAVMQRHFEGVTTVNGDGTHSYTGGKITPDTNFSGGYRRWDTAYARWVNVDTRTQQGGIFGLDQGTPQLTGVPVHAIGITISNAGTAGATQIYPAIDYVGNLMRTIDPTSAADRAAITPDTGTYFWYCRNGGCDYTVRVTYVDGTQRSALIQGGFRPFNQPTGAPPPTTLDPLNAASQQTWFVNMPGTVAISKVELLSTPQVWSGMPANPQVLAQR